MNKFINSLVGLAEGSLPPDPYDYPRLYLERNSESAIVAERIFNQYNVKLVPVYSRSGPSYFELPRRLQHLATGASPNTALSSAFTSNDSDFPSLETITERKPRKTPTFKKGKT